MECCGFGVGLAYGSYLRVGVSWDIGFESDPRNEEGVKK
jgi:hypothetical protein